MSETPTDLNDALYQASVHKQTEKVQALLNAGADPQRAHGAGASVSAANRGLSSVKQRPRVGQTMT